MSLTNSNSNTAPRGSISILGGMQRQLADAGKADGKQERAPSLFWANIGFNIVGGGENGEDLFVTLPIGLALDDMKPTVVRGNKSHWIQLAQAKNHLLETLKGAAAQLEPGESAFIDDLKVQLYRKGEPEQTGSQDSNPLIAQMAASFGK